MYQNFDFSKEGAIGIIDMKGITLKPEFAGELLDILYKATNDTEVRVVLIKNDNKYFSVGGDLSSPNAPNTSLEFKEFIHRFGAVVHKIYTMPEPVVCLVNGMAAGGGANLALCCDFVLISEKAAFAEVFVNINYVPDTGGLYNLVQLIGIRKAKEICMTAKKINGQEAVEMGLANRLVPSEQLMAEGMKLANELASKPPLALRFIKELCFKMPELSYSTYSGYEENIMLLLRTCDDYKEGIAAFKEKRQPVFTGK